MQKPILKSPGSLAIIGTLGLLIVVAAWLLGPANATPLSSPGPIAPTATPELQARSLASDTEVWPALPGLATFGDEVRLLSFDLPASRFPPGGTLEVKLYWQTQAVTSTHSVFVHILDANDNLVAQADAPLANTPCADISRFSAGAMITCYALPLPDTLAAGQYHLAVGIYDSNTGRRLATAEGQSVFHLATIEVAAIAENLTR
jgi:hypothetical protein